MRGLKQFLTTEAGTLSWVKLWAEPRTGQACSGLLRQMSFLSSVEPHQVQTKYISWDLISENDFLPAPGATPLIHFIICCSSPQTGVVGVCHPCITTAWNLRKDNFLPEKTDCFCTGMPCWLMRQMRWLCLGLPTRGSPLNQTSPKRMLKLHTLIRIQTKILKVVKANQFCCSVQNTLSRRNY